MCGIVGIVGPLADRVGARWLPEAVAALHHRGPDGHGEHVAPGVALGHTRLAIRDLSPLGAQPMHAPASGHVIVYNGELYNVDTLSRPLHERGWQPRGHADTEVLLAHLVAHSSPGHAGPTVCSEGGAEGSANPMAAAFAQLDGMFAFAFVEPGAAASAGPGRAWLVRDRVGIKPLYYAELEGSVAFASELSVLAALQGVDKRLDRTALSHYLSLGMVPAPATMLRGVRQLQPGCYLVREPDGTTRVARYTPWIGVDQAEIPADPQQQDAALEALILDAVRQQVVADVPVGVLLSGGVDSSVVAAAASRVMEDVHTFSVISDDPAHDERVHARAVAEHIGSTHVEIPMPSGGLTQAEFDELIDHHGDPFADSSSLPTRRLAREVQRHVPVALSGDGGDELFAGYPRYWQNQLVEGAARLPSGLRRPLRSVTGALTEALTSERLRGLSRRVDRTLCLAERDPWERAVGTLTYFWPSEQHTLLQPEFRGSPRALAELVAAHTPVGWPAGQPDACHRMEQHLNLPGDMLTKVDRMTMAASLEIRPVLLSNAIVQYAAALPMERKLVGREGKAILRALARRWVPPEVVDRPKRGFSVSLLDYGGPVLADATRWALESPESPLQQLLLPGARAALQAEFARRGEGVDPEDSVFRRVHRQWTVTLLAAALARLGVVL